MQYGSQEFPWVWDWGWHWLHALKAADSQADANALLYSSQTRDRLKSANVPVEQMIAFTDLSSVNQLRLIIFF